jgi:hypothetical protein
MRKIFLLCMLIPILGISQNKNIVNANRVFPKVDKALEFEKALGDHARKYHSGEWSWRVFEIQSGPDAGGYHITEGPSSWEGIDGRGNLGTEHNTDWNKSVAIHLTDRGSSSYSAYQDSLSTVKLTDWADKINITHYIQKIGWGNKVWEMLKNSKPVWQALGQSNAVYTSSSSGPPQYTVVTRYKNGLKERSTMTTAGFKEQYEKIHGADSFDGYLEILRNYVAEQWSELLFYRADLSSK